MNRARLIPGEQEPLSPCLGILGLCGLQLERAGPALKAPGHLQPQQGLGLATLRVPNRIQSWILELSALEGTCGHPPVQAQCPGRAAWSR